MITKFSASSISGKLFYRSMLAGNSAFIPSFYEQISTTSISSNTASVTLNSGGVWAGYKHLQLRISARTDRAAELDILQVAFNGDALGSSYARHHFIGDGGSVSTANGVSQSNMWGGWMPGGSAGSNIFSSIIIDILDVNVTTKNTTIRSIGGTRSGGAYISGLVSGFWNNTAAVTSITLAGLSTNFVSGTKIALYGVKG